MGTNSRDSDNLLSRRFSNHVQDQGGIDHALENGMSKIDPIGLVDKSKEIVTNSIPDYGSFRNGHRYKNHDALGSRQEDQTDTTDGTSIIITDDDIMDTLGTVYWNHPGNPSGKPTSPVSNQASSASTQPFSSSDTGPYLTIDEEGFSLVAQPTTEMERTTNALPITSNPDFHRCITNGLWNRLERPIYSRHLVTSGTTLAHQPKRITSCEESFTADKYPFTSSHSALYGQHFLDGLYPPFWRNKISTPKQSCYGNMDSLLSELHTIINSILSLKVQPSRCSVPSDQVSDRMVHSSNYLSTSRPEMWPSSSEPICISSTPSASELCHLEIPSSSSVDKCLQLTLVSDQTAPLSSATLELNTSNPPTSSSASSTCHSDNSSLAVRSLVSSSDTTRQGSSNHSPRYPSRSKRQRAPSGKEQSLANVSLEPPLKRTTTIVLSPEAKKVIVFSPAAKKRAHHRWLNYVDWCKLRDEDPDQPSAILLINYLAENQAVKSWKPSTVTNYAFYISEQYDTSGQLQIRNSTEFKDFLKGLGNATFKPLRVWDYDIQPVLAYLTSLGDNNTLSITDLTAKTAWLLSMAGFLRPSDLARTDINSCHILPGRILHLVVLGPKEKRQGSRITKSITIHPHKNPRLCPVSAYSCYLSRQASSPCLINHEVNPEIQYNALLRYVNENTLALGSERISHFISSIMQHVGKHPEAPIPKPRALGATLAAQSGISVDDIVAHGDWSSKDLFEHFYRISATTLTNFTDVTLDEQQRSSKAKCNIM